MLLGSRQLPDTHQAQALCLIPSPGGDRDSAHGVNLLPRQLVWLALLPWGQGTPCVFNTCKQWMLFVYYLNELSLKQGFPRGSLPHRDTACHFIQFPFACWDIGHGGQRTAF